MRNYRCITAKPQSVMTKFPFMPSLFPFLLQFLNLAPNKYAQGPTHCPKIFISPVRKASIYEILCCHYILI